MLSPNLGLVEGSVGSFSLPTIVSTRPGAKTPLVDTMVRRSPRLNPNATDRVKLIKAKEPVSKRRKMMVATFDLSRPPKTADEARNPIPTSTIQDWALACGVAPGELSEEALMEGHIEEQV